jgi:transposase
MALASVAYEDLARLSLRFGLRRYCRKGRSLPGCKVVSCKKRSAAFGTSKRRNGTKGVILVDGQGIPLGSHTDPASPAEITFLDKALGEIRVPKGGQGRPGTRRKRSIGDKAYDSDPARKKLRQRGINLLIPHRKNHRNVNRQDDRLWDRYKRRYIVERTFRWITSFRRLVVRYENHISMFVAFFQMSCAIATLRKCL